jgi:hypothetical protein
MKRLLLAAIVFLAVWKLFSWAPAVSLGPGVFAESQPIHFGDYTLTPLAHFDITAKVLAREDYWWDRGADLSPTDLALGWGRMSDEAVLQHIDISQSARFYRWRVESFPIPRREIETNSANMHLVPADASVGRAIDRIREGEIVSIQGRLIEAHAKTHDWRWRSSLTRNDTGGGACELILVDRIKSVNPG